MVIDNYKKKNKSFFIIRGAETEAFFTIIKKSEDFKRVLQLNKKLTCRHCSVFYAWLPQKLGKSFTLKGAQQLIDQDERGAAVRGQRVVDTVVGKAKTRVNIGYIASKKLGSAVWRNRAKRRMRAGLLVVLQNLEKQVASAERWLRVVSSVYKINAEIDNDFNYALNLLLVAKNSTGICDFRELTADINYILRKISSSDMEAVPVK